MMIACHAQRRRYDSVAERRVVSRVLPENFLRLISAEERKAIGQPSAAEAVSKFVDRSEKKLQGEIAGYLRLHGLWFDQDAMHKRRTGTNGAPDFQFPYRGKNGRCCFVAWEVKTATGKLRDDQEHARVMIEAQGGQWRLIRSLTDAQTHLREIDL